MDAWAIVLLVIGMLLSIIGTLLILNLKGLKTCITKMNERLDKHESKIDKLIERKNFCNQDYVGKVEYIRSINGIEEAMKDLIKAVARLDGNMKVIEQMPAICGDIARSIAKEMIPNG